MFDMYVSERYESVGRPSVMLEMVKIKKLISPKMCLILFLLVWSNKEKYFASYDI